MNDEERTLASEPAAEEEAEADIASEESAKGENAESVGEGVDSVKQYEREDWKERVDGFVKKYPIAERYAETIGEIIAGDESMAMREDCLEAALIEALAAKRREPSEYAADDTFLEEYVYGNEAVRAKIIDEYLSGLYESRKPVTIDGKGRSVLTLPRRPSNIAEAGKLAENMFNNRRN